MSEANSTDLLADEVALVTGASRGLGAAIALTLAKAGATVIGTATTAAGAAAITTALNGCGRGAVYNATAAGDVDRLMA